MKKSWFCGCLHFLGEHISWKTGERARITRRDLENGGGALLCVLQCFDQGVRDVGFGGLPLASGAFRKVCVALSPQKGVAFSGLLEVQISI